VTCSFLFVAESFRRATCNYVTLCVWLITCESNSGSHPAAHLGCWLRCLLGSATKTNTPGYEGLASPFSVSPRSRWRAEAAALGRRPPWGPDHRGSALFSRSPHRPPRLKGQAAKEALADALRDRPRYGCLAHRVQLAGRARGILGLGVGDGPGSSAERRHPCDLTSAPSGDERSAGARGRSPPSCCKATGKPTRPKMQMPVPAGWRRAQPCFGDASRRRRDHRRPHLRHRDHASSSRPRPRRRSTAGSSGTPTTTAWRSATAPAPRCSPTTPWSRTGPTTAAPRQPPPSRISTRRCAPAASTRWPTPPRRST
jgi:hypothetical protein